jgi:hypothetical protein
MRRLLKNYQYRVLNVLGMRLGWYIVMFLRASRQARSFESYTSFRFPKWQLCVERFPLTGSP